MAGNAAVAARRGVTRREPLDQAVAFRFLRALGKNNDRTWFHANREDWDGHIRHGFEDLITMLLLDAASVDPRLRRVDPKACLFRLANDTRFRKDKSPYKPWLSAWLGPRGKSGAYAGYYVHLAPGTTHVSAGIYVPEKEPLHALRTVFLENGTAAREFDKLVRSKALAPYQPLTTDPLRVTPRGFPKDHARPELIRARNYLVARDISDAELRERGIFATMRDFIRATSPFVQWIDAHGFAARPEREEAEFDEWASP
jgi:uncharacterized protein (TIGR02453 family)